MLLLKRRAVFRCKPPCGTLAPRPNPTEQNYWSKCAYRENRQCSKPKMCIPWCTTVSSGPGLRHKVLAFWPWSNSVDRRQPGCSVHSILCLLQCGTKKALLYLGSPLCNYAAGASPVLAHLGFWGHGRIQNRREPALSVQQMCLRKSGKCPRFLYFMQKCLRTHINICKECLWDA